METTVTTKASTRIKRRERLTFLDSFHVDFIECRVTIQGLLMKGYTNRSKSLETIGDDVVSSM